jgi:5,10-methylene-tetrahydrofolate dehydrogenase/methenyl tetrahydrofolate cyclohydrolase
MGKKNIFVCKKREKVLKKYYSFHAVNVGNMAKKASTPLFLSCTPKGIVHLLKSTGVSLAGKEAVVIGRSDIVGSPVALLLTQEDCTVTLCHSKSKDMKALVSLSLSFAITMVIYIS